MTLEVNYQCNRRDLWRAYWRAWSRPAGLWRMHALVALVVALALPITERSPCPALPPAVEFLYVVAGVMLAVVALRLAWLQLAFRRIARRVVISPQGWRSRVGATWVERRWQDVAAVVELGDYVLIVSAPASAMVIPRRAFATIRDWRVFVRAAKRWHRGEIAP